MTTAFGAANNKVWKLERKFAKEAAKSCRGEIEGSAMWLFVLSVKTWPNLFVRNLLALGQAQVTASPVETSSIQARGRWIA
jgi:hypothetical protein